MEKKLIVGLGNPGERYRETRHNLGAMVVEAIGKQLSLEFKKKSMLRSQIAVGKYKETEVYLLLPATYMNLSGAAVKGALSFYGLTIKDLVVVVDDADLSFGKVRYRDKGSSGGHNGLKDIAKALGGTQDYARIKMGIDSKERQYSSLESYVLEPFASEEKKWLGEIIAAGVEVVEGWVELGALEATKRAEKVNKKLAMFIKEQSE